MDWDQLSARWPVVRDIMIVVVALSLIVHEAVIHGGPVRESLLFLYSGLLVTPVVMRGEDRRSGKQEPSPEKPQGAGQ